VAIDSIAAIVRTWGRERHDAVALRMAGRSVSFGELDRRSSQVANALAAEGVVDQDRVAFIDKNGVEYFEVQFGVAKLNAVMVAVNWRLAPGEMAAIVNDAQAKVVLVGPEFLGHVEKIVGDLRTVGRIVAIGESDRGSADWPGYEEWVAPHADVDPGVTAGPGDVALQLYTSGTTGLPKGVMLTNGNVFVGNAALAARFGLDAGSVNLAAMPLFHIGGIGWALIGLVQGCPTVLLREIDTKVILRLIEEFGVTHAFFVPAVIQFLLATAEAASTDFASLRIIAYGASPISDAVLSKAMARFDCGFVQLYGLTETTGAITALDVADHDPVRRPELLRSCGRSFAWVELRCVNPTDGHDVPTGAVGEIWTRSHQNMLGYWGNREATTATITPDGWLRTGDAGFLDADGYVYLHDRMKDMIVSGGENIYPAEIENVLMNHPDVDDVAVIGVPDDLWGEAVKAVAVRREGSSIGADDLIAFARDHLGGFKLPKSVDFVHTLPRNPSGKLLKRELRERFWEGEARRIH
jgi:long-chain acyl-CoA synthetase